MKGTRRRRRRPRRDNMDYEPQEEGEVTDFAVPDIQEELAGAPPWQRLGAGEDGLASECGSDPESEEEEQEIGEEENSEVEEAGEGE